MLLFLPSPGLQQSPPPFAASTLLYGLYGLLLGGEQIGKNNDTKQLDDTSLLPLLEGLKEGSHALRFGVARGDVQRHPAAVFCSSLFLADDSVRDMLTDLRPSSAPSPAAMALASCRDVAWIYRFVFFLVPVTVLARCVRF